MLEPYLAKLDTDWAAGCRNGAELWRRLRAGGFRGGASGRDGMGHRGSGAARRPDLALTRIAPPARRLSRLLTMQREQLSKADAITVAAVETGVPALAAARDLWNGFIDAADARCRGAGPWLADTGGSLLASFG